MSKIPDYTEFQHKGYTLRQFNDVWHYQIINADGKTVLTVNCSQKLTEAEAVGEINKFITQQHSKDAKKVKVCPVCGKEFEVSKQHLKYCSEKCRKKAIAKKELIYQKKRRAEKRAERLKAKPKPKVEPIIKKRFCNCCQKEFTPSDRFRVYCSNACKLKLRYKQKEQAVNRKPKKYTDALCWHCKNACGGCSWSKSLTPVEGWKAKEVKNVGYLVTKSYKVIECPEFEEGR